MKNNNQREGLSRKKECTRACFNTPTLWPFGQEATQRTSYYGLFLMSTLERRGGTFMYPRRQEMVNLISVGRTRRACCTCETLKKYYIFLDTFWAFLNMFLFSRNFTHANMFLSSAQPRCSSTVLFLWRRVLKCMKKLPKTIAKPPENHFRGTLEGPWDPI